MEVGKVFECILLKGGNTNGMTPVVLETGGRGPTERWKVRRVKYLCVTLRMKTNSRNEPQGHQTLSDMETVALGRGRRTGVGCGR